MRCVVVCIVMAVAAGVARGENSHLARAERALDELDYPVARSELGRALRVGTSGPAQLARIYLLSGIVSGAFGETRAALVHFQRALALSDAARLPAGYAPKISAPFAAAVESDRRLVAACSAGVLDIVDDPLDMVDAVVASDAYTVAVDQFGNQLTAQCIKPLRASRRRSMPPPGRRSRTRRVGEDVIGSLETEYEAPATRHVLSRWQLWGSAAVAASVAGSYYANDATAGGADNQRYQTYAFGTAAAFAAAAFVFGIDEYRDRRRARRRASAAIIPTRGGGAAMVGLEF